MDDSEATSLEQIRAFLAGSGEVRFAGQRREEVYAWVEKTLVRHRYASLDRAGKGLLRRYLERMTGLSRAQVTRLIRQHQLTGRVQAAAYQRNQFARRYTSTDLDLLAYVDKAHGNLSGPATKHILNREFEEFGIAAYQRLAGMPGGDLGGAPVPVTQLGSLPQAQHDLSAHAAHADSHRRAAQAAAQRLARIPAHRHRASGRSGWPQGSVSHQRRGPGDTVGDRRGHAPDLGTVANSGAGSHADAVPLCGSGLSTPTTAASSSTTPWPSCSASS